MRSRYILIAVVLVILAFGVGRLSAAPGTLDSPDVPGNTLSYTLEDIYNRLDTGAAGAQSTFTEPAAGPGTGTGHTLDQVMGVAPVVDDASGASTGDVLSTKTYWSRRTADWGHQSGTMPDNGAVTIVPTTTNQAIVAGYHNGSGYVEGDADLVATNIVSDVVIFEVTGSAIAATGDAAAGDVLIGKTFSNASAAGIAGTMPDNGAVTIVPTTTNQAIVAGYHNGSGKVLGDTDLISGSIKSGVDIFGVSGTYPLGSVPKTGQAACYKSNGTGTCTCGAASCPFGQDGDLQKGVSWPNPRFTDNSDGTVTDNLTGLIWLKDANCIKTQYSSFDTDHTAADDVNGDGKVTWQHAFDFVAGINAGTYALCGGPFTDWRLPNVREIQSLIHYGFLNPALPNTAGTGQWSAGNPFSNVYIVGKKGYWSSTTDMENTSLALRVFMENGTVWTVAKVGGLPVWPVRGGQ